MIRLVDAKDIVSSKSHTLPDYLALSHCWGRTTTQQAKATLKNVKGWRQGFSLGRLPRTFRDAAMITRRLGVGYLWIDSLCIIQDDKSDWERESSKMASIYQNSFLTLAATGSADGDCGCFAGFHEIPYHWSGRTVKDDKLWTPVSVEIAGFRRCFALTPPDDIRGISPYGISSSDQTLTGYPLLTRAWAFQERLVSPRVLHFGKTQMAWECRRAFWTEVFIFEDDPKKQDNGLPAYLAAPAEVQENPLPGFNQRQRTIPKDYPFEMMRKRFISLMTGTYTSKGPTTSVSSLRDLAKPDDHPDTIHEAWRMIFEFFSRLAMTYEMDRLPALSGIASAGLTSMMSTESSTNTYRGGIWSSHISEALYWAGTSHLAPRPALYRAPSFSWASVEGPITFRDPLKVRRFLDSHLGYLGRTSCGLLKCSSVPEGIDPYGRVTGGHIKLRSWTSRGRVSEQTDGRWLIEHVATSKRQKFWPGIPLAVAPMKDGDEVRLSLLERTKLHAGPLYDIPVATLNPKNFLVIALILRPRRLRRIRRGSGLA